MGCRRKWRVRDQGGFLSWVFVLSPRSNVRTTLDDNARGRRLFAHDLVQELEAGVNVEFAPLHLSVRVHLYRSRVGCAIVLNIIVVISIFLQPASVNGEENNDDRITDLHKVNKNG